ncbi:hypothetical protein N7445_006403 [Penicillium cf. griseofulvum]|nr:hypothetical protein N7445_006403 [Penicillium cf. griseofulvum]
METLDTQIPARKLKGSCDVCSTSKLRCDKQKPSCRRCTNLGHPCTYSPARRAGRPHRVRQESSKRRNQDQNQRQIQSQSVQQCFGAPDRNARNSDLTESTDFASQTESEMSCGIDLLPRAYTISHHQGDQSRTTEIPSSPCNTWSTRIDSDTDEIDCVKAALSIIEQLERNKGQLFGTPTYGSGSLTATEACQQLLTILICPCSEHVDVALLVASGCISLLDVVHGSTGADYDQGSANVDKSTSYGICTDGTSVSLGSCEHDIPMWSRPQSSSHKLASDAQVEDLSKISRLILKFMDRYCQDTKARAHWGRTTWVVGPVRAFLSSRLQYVTQEVARRLFL